MDAALEAAGREQDGNVGDGDLVQRALDLLTASLLSGGSHLDSTTGGHPPARYGGLEAFGWRLEGDEKYRALGRCVGYIDEDGIYLIPDAFYAEVASLSRRQGRNSVSRGPLSSGG